jgi:hypothetical protein
LVVDTKININNSKTKIIIMMMKKRSVVTKLNRLQYHGNHGEEKKQNPNPKVMDQHQPIEVHYGQYQPQRPNPATITTMTIKIMAMAMAMAMAMKTRGINNSNSNNRILLVAMWTIIQQYLRTIKFQVVPTDLKEIGP